MLTRREWPNGLGFDFDDENGQAVLEVPTCVDHRMDVGLVEHPGRKSGQLAGTWVSDLAERRKAIVLCETPCQSRFYYKRAQYYKDERYGSRATARCDGCREYTTRGRLYLPEERLTEPSGMSRPGQCWSPA